ncbi:hypothetical protein N7513_001399 [Penicillium frequentans]|nr:hypothetical protein N7513_001399 [Penicillium glabrum]
MSLPASSSNLPSPWQDRLLDHCRRTKLAAPIFNIVSDRRGGRTAWSSTVLVQGRTVAARYWYDGQYINNAKEDAAEVALGLLQNQTRVPTVYPGQVWRQDLGNSNGA